MAKAKKLPSGNWRVLVFTGYDENKKRKYKSFTHENKKEAEFLAAEYAAHLKEQSGTSTMTVGDAYDRYIASKSSVLSPSTVREYKRSRKHDLPSLMPVRFTDLTQELVQQAVNEAAKTHSAKSVRNMHGLLSAVLGMYLPSFKLNTTLPQRTKFEGFVPSDKEIQKLVSGIKDTEMEAPVLLAAFGSLRRSEICPLEDTDIVGTVVNVNKAMVQDENKQWVIKPPKTFSGYRKVELSEFIISRLPKAKGRIVNLNPNQITSRFAHVLHRLGIPHFRFHDLRHYQASILLALGVPDKYVMERGGWKSETTLKKIYQHILSQKKDEVARQINHHFDSIMQHEMQHEKEKSR
jgi:integrase